MVDSSCRGAFVWDIPKTFYRRAWRNKGPQMSDKKKVKLNFKTGANDGRLILYFTTINRALLNIPKKERLRILNALLVLN